MRFDTEVFFRPEEIAREASRIRADLYNRCRLALARSVTDCAFVPVRNMQMQAVITQDEVIFVDNLNYAVHDGQGGRLIMLAWDFSGLTQRDSLDEPVPLEIVTFHASAADLHNRLMSELPAALTSQERQVQNESGRPATTKIIPFGRQ